MHNNNVFRSWQINTNDLQIFFSWSKQNSRRTVSKNTTSTTFKKTLMRSWRINIKNIKICLHLIRVVQCCTCIVLVFIQVKKYFRVVVKHFKIQPVLLNKCFNQAAIQLKSVINFVQHWQKQKKTWVKYIFVNCSVFIPLGLFWT